MFSISGQISMTLISGILWKCDFTYKCSEERQMAHWIRNAFVEQTTQGFVNAYKYPNSSMEIRVNITRRSGNMPLVRRGIQTPDPLKEAMVPVALNHYCSVPTWGQRDEMALSLTAKDIIGKRRASYSVSCHILSPAYVVFKCIICEVSDIEGTLGFTRMQACYLLAFSKQVWPFSNWYANGLCVQS